MRYIDSSINQPDQSVAHWMTDALSEPIGAFHCQAGYFTLEGASLLVPILRQSAAEGARIQLLLGANQGATIASHISYLVGLLDLPREHVALGVVSFDGALFHPKVYHITRADGSKTAYVGSSNLTGPGIIGRNVEAGILLDTRTGDDENILERIVWHIENWFESALPGLAKIGSVADIDALLETDVLSIQSERRVADEDGDGDRSSNPGRSSGARRAGLFKLPAIPPPASPAEVREEPPKAISKDAEANQPEDDLLGQRFLRATEASFHFPQGVHIGHLFSILCAFSGERGGTAFDDKFIRLSGSLGQGRISAFRRQIKYKMLAAIELKLLNDIRLLSERELYSPKLTNLGATLWKKMAPHLKVSTLTLDAAGMSTTTSESATYYNGRLQAAQAADPEIRSIWSGIVLSMPAVRLMADFIFRDPKRRIVTKAEIYEQFFEYPKVISFCDEMGIEPQTVTSAQHRLPFILNLLESCNLIEQRATSIIIPNTQSPENEAFLKEIQG